MKTLITGALLFPLLSLMPGLALAASDWNASLELGHASFAVADASDGLFSTGPTGASAPSSESGAVYRVTVGYQFSPNFRIESGYASLGQFRQSVNAPGFCTVQKPGCGEIISAGIRSRGYLLEAVGVLPLQGGWELYARGGLFLSHTDAYYSQDFYGQGSNAGATYLSNFNNHSLPTFGAGIDWRFSKNIAVKLGIDLYDGLGNKATSAELFGTGQYDEKVVAVGLIYWF